MATKATETKDETTESKATETKDETTESKATETKPAKAPKQQGKDGVYYIVNPAGAIHSVNREHARSRLRIAGWRLAEEAEITAYKGQKIQRHDRPIAPKWSPDPDQQLTELDD